MAAQLDNESRIARRKLEEVEQVGRYGNEEGSVWQGRAREAWTTPPCVRGVGNMLKCAVGESAKPFPRRRFDVEPSLQLGPASMNMVDTCTLSTNRKA